MSVLFFHSRGRVWRYWPRTGLTSAESEITIRAMGSCFQESFKIYLNFKTNSPQLELFHLKRNVRVRLASHSGQGLSVPQLLKFIWKGLQSRKLIPLVVLPPHQLLSVCLCLSTSIHCLCLLPLTTTSSLTWIRRTGVTNVRNRNHALVSCRRLGQQERAHELPLPSPNDLNYLCSRDDRKPMPAPKTPRSQSRSLLRFGLFN